MYCRNYNKNSWAVLGGNYKNFILNCKNLKEININISTLVRFQLLDVKSSRDSFNRT
ncbi:unnamed protein product [Dracunculus medinensis]|uniref:Uncharacterized protein n=1 Tax=Dracunculus medinensis TaxID=318479 RepID=A0A0N4UKF0_DRAME|nr:unnamed protein product [Dracunculus medinensis]